ncbi:MAG: sulfotransferase family 2 domain-containing protein [Alteromonadaceae bacterium]|nr:sulfotransferase family 2 domain-containing protein [Alteromonadaceae bacterium]
MPLLIKPDNQTLLFVHIPKTAGTSIKSRIKSDIKLALNVEFKQELPCPPQHFHFELLERLGFASYCCDSFAVVRHPLTRFISEFAYLKKVDKKFKHVNLLTFALLCKKIYPINKYIFSNHIRPQSEFISNSTRVFKIEDGISHVYDAYPEFFITEKSKQKSVVANKSNSNSIIADSLSANIVQELYKEDYKNLNYNFTLENISIRNTGLIELIVSHVLSTLISWSYKSKKR